MQTAPLNEPVMTACRNAHCQIPCEMKYCTPCFTAYKARQMSHQNFYQQQQLQQQQQGAPPPGFNLIPASRNTRRRAPKYEGSRSPCRNAGCETLCVRKYCKGCYQKHQELPLSPCEKQSCGAMCRLQYCRDCYLQYNCLQCGQRCRRELCATCAREERRSTRRHPVATAVPEPVPCATQDCTQIPRQGREICYECYMSSLTLCEGACGKRTKFRLCRACNRVPPPTPAAEFEAAPAEAAPAEAAPEAEAPSEAEPAAPEPLAPETALDESGEAVIAC